MGEYDPAAETKSANPDRSRGLPLRAPLHRRAGTPDATTYQCLSGALLSAGLKEPKRPCASLSVGGDSNPLIPAKNRRLFGPLLVLAPLPKRSAHERWFWTACPLASCRSVIEKPGSSVIRSDLSAAGIADQQVVAVEALSPPAASIISPN